MSGIRFSCLLAVWFFLSGLRSHDQILLYEPLLTLLLSMKRNTKLLVATVRLFLSLLSIYACLQTRGQVQARPVRILAQTAEDRRALSDLAASACRGKVPKPPPGYKHKRTPGFPLADLDLLFGHVLNALGPDIATAKGTPTSPKHDVAVRSKGNKRARGPGTMASEGGGKRRRPEDQSEVVNPAVKSGNMQKEVEDDGGNLKQSGVKSEPMEEIDEASPPPEAERERGGKEARDLTEAKEAFGRVLCSWEGAAMEGKRELHQRVIARLGRMLAEAEAERGSQEKTEAVKVAEEDGEDAPESQVTVRNGSLALSGRFCVLHVFVPHTIECWIFLVFKPPSSACFQKCILC